ncbi:hypothetical protein HC891_15125 [Candidatus Gracilibacteria bacterium]|nr:hypothetical protein [Candidatus Gracilibacteria bacterium]
MIGTEEDTGGGAVAREVGQVVVIGPILLDVPELLGAPVHRAKHPSRQ